MANINSLLQNNQVLSVEMDPAFQARTEKMYKKISSFIETFEKDKTEEELTELSPTQQRLRNRVLVKELRERTAFSNENDGQPKYRQSLMNLSVGGIMGDTFRQMRDQTLDRFKSNSVFRFGRNIKNAYTAFKGGEISNKELVGQRKSDGKMDELLEGVEEINENLVNLGAKPKDKKKEEKSFFRTLFDMFTGYKIFDFLKNTLFGGAAIGAGALGLKAAASGGLFAGAAAAATKAGTVLAGMGLFGAIAGGLIGTIGDSLIAWSNSETWKASDTKKIIGSILGGQGGGWSAAFRGLAFAGIGFKIGSALFPPFGGIIGAILGGSLGAIAGFIGGQKIAEGLEDLGDWFSDTWKSFIYKLLGKPLEVALDEAEKTSKNLNPQSKFGVDLQQEVDLGQDLQAKKDAAQEKYNSAEKAYNEGFADHNISPTELKALKKELNEARKEYKEIDSKAQVQSDLISRKNDLYNTYIETGEILDDPNASKKDKRLAFLRRLKAKSKFDQRELLSKINEEPIKPPEVLAAEQYVDDNTSWYNIGNLFLPKDIKQSVNENDKIIQAHQDKVDAEKAKLEAKYRDLQRDIAGMTEEENSINLQYNHLHGMLPANQIDKRFGGEPAAQYIRDAEQQSQQIIENLKPYERPEVDHDPDVPDVLDVPDINTSLWNPDPNMNEEQLKRRSKELIKYEEMGVGDPKFAAVRDPTEFWEDGETPRYQIGYGSNYLNGKKVTRDDRLNGVTYVKRDPKNPDIVLEVGGDKDDMMTHARKLLEDDVVRIRGEFDAIKKAEYNVKEIFEKLDPARKIVLTSTMYQMGAEALANFDDAWPLISKAADLKTNQAAWNAAANEMERSIWHNEQTPERADRVIEVIRNGGPVVWGDKTIYKQSQPNAAAEGHMAYGPEKIIVGDYKGIQNNPEVTMPMSDLEERVLTTVTRMVNLRDVSARKNQEIQMMNREMKMRNLMENAEQIAKRVQTKDNLNNSSRMVTLPPIINSPVDNSKITTNNQSIIVNRSVQNQHNPFLMLT